MTTKSPEPPKDAGSSTSSVPSSVPSQGSSSAEQTTTTQPTVPTAPAPPAQSAAAPPAKGVPLAKGPAPSAKGVATPATPTTTPPVPPAKATAKPARPPRGGGGAVPLAILSLLLALAAVGISIYSLDVAREAKSQTAPTAPGADGRGGAASTANASAPPGATPATTSRGPTFLPELVRTEVQLPAPDSCAAIYVDVDTTQVGVYTGHEFYLSSCLGPAAIRIDRASGAAPTAENATPEGCAAQLAGAATTTELVLPLRADLTFCLLTNKTDATQQGIPQRIGIVEVKQIRADRMVTLAISTFRMPPTPS